MSTARLKEFLRQIIVAVWGENVLSDTVVSTVTLRLQRQTNCSPEWHFHSYREEEEESSFLQVSVWNGVIIKRCNEVWTTLFQGAVARIPHKLWGLCLIKEILHCLSTVIRLGVYLSEPSRDSVLICCNHRGNERTVTPPRWSQRGCYCKTWHFDPMGSVKLRLRSLNSKHQRERLRQTARDGVCVWQLRTDAQLQTVPTDAVTGRLNLGCFQ